MARKHRIWRTTALLGTICALAACAAQRQPLPLEVIWVEQAWSDLDAAKEAAAREAAGEPRVVHFPGHGEITVREWALEGYPGNTWVRARFTYENTTGRAIDYVSVWLTVMDSEGVPVARQSTDLFMPTGLGMNPGTLFADELRTQTRDVHRKPDGWKWSLGCEAVFLDGEPADAPYPAEPWVTPKERYSGWVIGK